ncbi:MAG TPA: malate synthase A [Gemmatimonadaceae bacterium]|nr:malate synthase A [Gemmatimonadaceae bacterium]
MARDAINHEIGVTRTPPGSERVLTPDAQAFVARLQREFGAERQVLLDARAARQHRLDAGERPRLLPETASIRAADWRVAPPAPSMAARRIEITGPAERKMMINAFNSGADGFMADLEDSLSPTWDNVVEAQANLQDAVRGSLDYTAPDGKAYRLNPKIATLLVRPRGWHLVERHVRVDGQPMSASLFDFGMFFYHNAREQIARGAVPCFYVPKLESHREARLWHDVFAFAERELGIAPGTIRVTILIETILAAFEMDEILYELRDYGAALNAGRWDYIFSIIKKFHVDPAFVLPDRVQVTMTVPFMRAYAERLVRTCHHRGAQAIGGMAAFIPSRRDPQINATAMTRVTEDKQREAGDGFDGTWIAHPDLVPVALQAFANRSGASRDAAAPDADPALLLDVRIPGGTVTEAGVRNNISVALQYLEAWMRGSGAVGINNLMEDAATAEISRSQLWQWIHHRAHLAGGGHMTQELYDEIRTAELITRRAESGHKGRWDDAAVFLDDLVTSSAFPEFLTTAGAHYLK